MQFDATGTAPPVPVVWYFVPADRPLLQQETPFRSANWIDWTAGPWVAGEVDGAARAWRNGSRVSDAVPASSADYCGALSEWAGGLGPPPWRPVAVDWFGTPLCCPNVPPAATVAALKTGGSDLGWARGVTSEEWPRERSKRLLNFPTFIQTNTTVVGFTPHNWARLRTRGSGLNSREWALLYTGGHNVGAFGNVADLRTGGYNTNHAGNRAALKTGGTSEDHANSWAYLKTGGKNQGHANNMGHLKTGGGDQGGALITFCGKELPKDLKLTISASTGACGCAVGVVVHLTWNGTTWAGPVTSFCGHTGTPSLLCSGGVLKLRWGLTHPPLPPTSFDCTLVGTDGLDPNLAGDTPTNTSCSGTWHNIVTSWP